MAHMKVRAEPRVMLALRIRPTRFLGWHGRTTPRSARTGLGSVGRDSPLAREAAALVA